MKFINSYAFAIILLCSCGKGGDPTFNACQDNTVWLSQKIQELEQLGDDIRKYTYISQAEYLGSPVYIVANCCPTCNSVFYAYNCAGENVGTLGCGKGFIDFNILDNDVIVWQPNNFVCADSSGPTC